MGWSDLAERRRNLARELESLEERVKERRAQLVASMIDLIRPVVEEFAGAHGESQELRPALTTAAEESLRAWLEAAFVARSGGGSGRGRTAPEPPARRGRSRGALPEEPTPEGRNEQPPAGSGE